MEGILFTVVGIRALLSYVNAIAWASAIWPILILAVGILHLVLIYLRHPISDRSAIGHDSRQHQNTLIAIAIAVAGAAEFPASSITHDWNYLYRAKEKFHGAVQNF